MTQYTVLAQYSKYNTGSKVRVQYNTAQYSTFKYILDSIIEFSVCSWLIEYSTMEYIK